MRDVKEMGDENGTRSAGKVAIALLHERASLQPLSEEQQVIICSFAKESIYHFSCFRTLR
jgi:hypothetical protein